MIVEIPIELKLTPHSRDVMESLTKLLGHRFLGQVEPEEATANKPPRIGEYWAGQGGIYAGITRGEYGQPDHHLILAEAALEIDFKWQAALDHAKTIEADGHKDFAVPTRFESALLYANVRDKLDTGRWHWTSTQSGETNAFYQHFDDGYQSYGVKSVKGRCRFVRRLNSSTL